MPKLRRLALEHLGGDPNRHDVLVLNRLTAALFATHLELVAPGTVVLGVSARFVPPGNGGILLEFPPTEVLARLGGRRRRSRSTTR